MPETLLAAEAPASPPLGAGERKAFVLFNPKAGSVTPGDRQKLMAALCDNGIAHFAFYGAEKLSKQLLQRAKQFDVLVVLGGDGTAKTVAELAPRDGPPLILLPGGTLNILPHALYGAIPWPEALKQALERGYVTNLPTGRANGRAFYIAAIFGAPTLLARAREAVREGNYLTALRRFHHAGARMFSHKVRGRTGSKGRFQKSDAVGVLLPAFSGDIEGKEMEWVRLTTDRLLDFARVSLRALSDAWRNDPSIEIDITQKGEITSHGIIPATLDGEPVTFLGEVKITYERKGPCVIAVEQPKA